MKTLLDSPCSVTEGPWSRGHRGTLLVLGSANSDEHNRGYNDRYDCSSADINPIGSLSKAQVCSCLRWAAREFEMPLLEEAASAQPLSETEPEEEAANDEADMGMSYPELTRMSELRKAQRCGPLSMFHHLCEEWGAKLSPEETARKVKIYFFYFSLFRHLMTSMPPAMHATPHNPDDNRHDLRQFVYNSRWPRQFQSIDAALERMGLSASLPQTECQDGPDTVPCTMSGHFVFPPRSNVEIGRAWAAVEDAPSLVMMSQKSREHSVQLDMSIMSDTELETMSQALEDERRRRKDAKSQCCLE